MRLSPINCDLLCRRGIFAVPLLGAAAPAPCVYTVPIAKMKFGAVPIGARAGDTAMWVNPHMIRHTAFARNGSFNIDLPSGNIGKTMLKRARAIAFYCVHYPGITRTLNVLP